MIYPFNAFTFLSSLFLAQIRLSLHFPEAEYNYAMGGSSPPAASVNGCCCVSAQWSPFSYEPLVHIFWKMVYYPECICGGLLALELVNEKDYWLMKIIGNYQVRLFQIF